jgi:hypothetical protein
MDKKYVRKHGKMTIRMAYEMVMPYHLHMPSYFLETFTEYPYGDNSAGFGDSNRTVGKA